MTVSTSNLIGVSLGYADTSASFNVGTAVNLDDGGQAVYVQAASEISQYAAVAVLSNNTAVMLTTTNAATSKRVGFAGVHCLRLVWLGADGRRAGREVGCLLRSQCAALYDGDCGRAG